VRHACVLLLVSVSVGLGVQQLCKLFPFAVGPLPCMRSRETNNVYAFQANPPNVFLTGNDQVSTFHGTHLTTARMTSKRRTKRDRTGEAMSFHGIVADCVCKNASGMCESLHSRATPAATGISRRRRKDRLPPKCAYCRESTGAAHIVCSDLASSAVVGAGHSRRI
jgi:hypothetical protein